MLLKLYIQFAQTGILGECGELGLPRCEEGDANGVEQLLSIVFLAAGAVSILYIIIGAGRFAAANGDPASIKQARNTILYAVIGLVISLASFSIVNFVVRSS